MGRSVVRLPNYELALPSLQYNSNIYNINYISSAPHLFIYRLLFENKTIFDYVYKQTTHDRPRFNTYISYKRDDDNK